MCGSQRIHHVLGLLIRVEIRMVVQAGGVITGVVRSDDTPSVLPPQPGANSDTPRTSGTSRFFRNMAFCLRADWPNANLAKKPAEKSHCQQKETGTSMTRSKRAPANALRRTPDRFR